MTSPVIDLSHWNPDPDFAAMKAAGVVAMIHKATENVSYLDKKLRQRIADAHQAGLLTATYHFLRFGNIEQQMGWYLSAISPVQGERVVIDYEDDAIPIAQLEQAVAYLWRVRPDLQITIYSGHTIKDKLGSHRSELLSKTSLWIAQYTSAKSPSWPKATWPQWSLWQWTDEEKVPGINGRVDGNRWNGSPDALARWMCPAEPVPVPEPAEPDHALMIEMTVPKGVDIVINGQKVVIT